jgi:3-oxoadipate enol-lactonase/3-oxoadipate enol-lactonase/4-carboxymuconolactone decarboxylase
MAADITQILDAEGVEKATVLGLSMGGAVAQAMARQVPKRVAGLVLVSTFACKQVNVVEKIFPFLAPFAIRVLTVQRLAELNGVFGTGGDRADPRFITLIKRVFATQTEESMVACSKAIFHFDSRPWLGRLTCPTLILTGTPDWVMPMHHAEMLKDLLPSAQLYICPNAGHAMFYTHANWLMGKLLPFLEEVMAKQSLSKESD